jgi:hypothetical protein
MAVNPEPVASTSVDATAARRKKPTCPTCGQSPKQPRRATTDENYRRAAWRLIENYTQRVAAGGLPVLADVVALRDVITMVIDAGVDACRGEQWKASWTEIGEATGMTAQGAQQRWGSLGGARRPGGQPSNLR